MSLQRGNVRSYALQILWSTRTHLVTAVWVGNPDWRQKMTQGSDSF